MTTLYDNDPKTFTELAFCAFSGDCGFGTKGITGPELLDVGKRDSTPFPLPLQGREAFPFEYLLRLSSLVRGFWCMGPPLVHLHTTGIPDLQEPIDPNHLWGGTQL